MLKQLRIRNFKGWKDTDTIRMAPISLFFWRQQLRQIQHRSVSDDAETNR